MYTFALVGDYTLGRKSKDKRLSIKYRPSKRKTISLPTTQKTSLRETPRSST